MKLQIEMIALKRENRQPGFKFKCQVVEKSMKDFIIIRQN